MDLRARSTPWARSIDGRRHGRDHHRGRAVRSAAAAIACCPIASRPPPTSSPRRRRVVACAPRARRPALLDSALLKLEEAGARIAPATTGWSSTWRVGGRRPSTSAPRPTRASRRTCRRRCSPSTRSPRARAASPRPSSRTDSCTSTRSTAWARASASRAIAPPSSRASSSLRAAPVMATDLRASFGLVIAGLAAEGETGHRPHLPHRPGLRVHRGEARRPRRARASPAERGDDREAPLRAAADGAGARTRGRRRMITLALNKGRILDEVLPLLETAPASNARGSAQLASADLPDGARRRCA